MMASEPLALPDWCTPGEMVAMVERDRHTVARVMRVERLTATQVIVVEPSDDRARLTRFYRSGLRKVGDGPFGTRLAPLTDPEVIRWRSVGAVERALSKLGQQRIDSRHATETTAREALALARDTLDTAERALDRIALGQP